jgi:hypothetical protein
MPPNFRSERFATTTGERGLDSPEQRREIIKPGRLPSATRRAWPTRTRSSPFRSRPPASGISPAASTQPARRPIAKRGGKSEHARGHVPQRDVEQHAREACSQYPVVENRDDKRRSPADRLGIKAQPSDCKYQCAEYHLPERDHQHRDVGLLLKILHANDAPSPQQAGRTWPAGLLQFRLRRSTAESASGDHTTRSQRPGTAIGSKFLGVQARRTPVPRMAWCSTVRRICERHRGEALCACNRN